VRFQFSDNYYPVFPFFIHNVAEGVEYQMRRLNRHPSMAPRLQQHAVIVLAHGNWMDRNGTGSAHHSATEAYNLGLGQVFNHADIPAGQFAVESGAM
jgi:hypothetical protein